MNRKAFLTLAAIVLIASMAFFFNHWTCKPVALGVPGLFYVELPACAVWSER